MSFNDGVFKNLRYKLDVFGYKHSLPLAAIPLVGAIFEDLVKTTESLRDAKKNISQLLEEKHCWELGVEPYKCDNSRLLTECNKLHLEILKQQDEYEKRAIEYNQKVRNLQSDKFHLEEQCIHLQQQIQRLSAKQVGNLAMGKDAMFKSRKPFISTVRSGQELPPIHPLGDHVNNTRCSKCNAAGCTLRSHGASDFKNANCLEKEIAKLERSITDLKEQLAHYKNKVESRDREISRLNELLSGGRPPSALAKDCCYKKVASLANDIELLQREKSENINKLHTYQDQMHEAMQRALNLETINRQLRSDLEEIKKAALQIEQQANADAEKRDREIEKLKLENRRLLQKLGKAEGNKQKGHLDSNADKLRALEEEQMQNAAEKRRLNEQLNTITQREIELQSSNQNLYKKLHVLKSKLVSVRKELKDSVEQNRCATLDEEKIRLKSERDFFQKEYLRLISKAGSEKEIEFLQNQVKSKDEELHILRSELCFRDDLHLPMTPLTDCTSHQLPNPSTGITGTNSVGCPSQQHENHRNSIDVLRVRSCGDLNPASSSSSSATINCVQAAVLRAERERDTVRAELERVRCERDTLREKNLSLLQAQADESQKIQQRLEELNSRIRELERENRELNSARLPSETHIVLLKEEIEDVRGRLCAAQEENCLLKTQQRQLKVLQEQTERSLLEYQNKLTIAEHQLESNALRAHTSDSNRETMRSEVTQLRNEVNALRQTYIALEREKDGILVQLDSKTQRVCHLEQELKSCQEKRDAFKIQVSEFENRLSELTRENQSKRQELQEKSTEIKILRFELEALKKSRDNAITENSGLIDNCSDIKAENHQLKKDLEEQRNENDALKKKISEYVQEIQKTEEILLRKEKEREEMLEQYRSLSQDTVALQGNNHSLEEEAAEYKRQVADYEREIETLKKELKHRSDKIDEMEVKIASLTERNLGLQHRLEEVQEDKHLIKMDLTSRSELCKRLEEERTKLNAEIDELNNALRAAKLEKNNDKHQDTKMEEDDSENLLETTLQQTRFDLETQLRLGNRLHEELLRLRKQNESLMEDLEAANRKNMNCEKLIHEYFVQNQELRHNLTDDRFRQARAREQQQQQQKRTTSSLRFSKDLEKDHHERTPAFHISSTVRVSGGLSEDASISDDSCTNILHDVKTFEDNDSREIACGLAKGISDQKNSTNENGSGDSIKDGYNSRNIGYSKTM